MSAIVLASTSLYRRQLLARLVPDFVVQAPSVDEAPLADETPLQTAQRLAKAKAEAVALDHPGALVIGSDQLAELDGRALGKAGTAEAASRQLAACSGKTVRFHTAVTLIAALPGGNVYHHATDCTRVVFRQLDEATITRYVAAEQPFDCAGSFKVEGLGIALFNRVESDDPTALIGLPLIAVAQMLREAGIALP